MLQSLAELLVTAFLGYAAVGVVFAVAFAWRGAGRLDASARAGTAGFRLIILPAALALWPLLAWKWLTHRRRGETRR